MSNLSLGVLISVFLYEKGNFKFVKRSYGQAVAVPLAPFPTHMALFANLPETVSISVILRGGLENFNPHLGFLAKY